MNSEIGLTKKILSEYTTSHEARYIWQEKIKQKDFPVWVATVDNDVVAYVTPNIDEKGRNRLGSLYVLFKYQGLGIGAILLKKSKEYWSEKPGDLYILIADYNFQAIDFYKNHGFKFTGSATEFYSVTPDVSIPVLEMVFKS